MPKQNKHKLVEQKPLEFMNDTEKRLKKRLVNLLRDDGRGHHHAKYAERLEKFDIQIVPLKVDPKHTASISYDRGIITIGEGFITDPSTFYQLNVLIRHELAHNLLMHQVRMAYALGEETFSHIMKSQLLFNIQNIVADDEISNRKYSEEDKTIMRNLIVNGEEIHALVTEDHRKGWVNMSVEEMYENVCEEIKAIHKEILSGRSKADLRRIKSKDFISQEILNTYIYSDIDSDSMIKGSLKDFVASGCRTTGGKKLMPHLSDVVTQIFNALDGTDVDDSRVAELMNTIAKSSPIETVDLLGDKKILLYTPEEKYIAMEVLKKFKSEYAEWYGKVLSSLDELSSDEIQELLDMLK
jgi:hypothetical protein